MRRSRFRQPSAYVPILMSLAALSLVLAHAAIYGIVHEEDEGAAAHTFQLLMVCQVPVIGWFVVRWLPQDVRRSLVVVAAQMVAVAAAFASVYFLT